MFHFREGVCARVGRDKLVGTFSCRRNGDNPRQLDFGVRAKVVPAGADAAAAAAAGGWQVDQKYFMS